MKDIQKEVTGVIKINSLFNILHILPITYLGDYLTISFTISRLVCTINQCIKGFYFVTTY
jgi:hypothetical protein